MNQEYDNNLFGEGFFDYIDPNYNPIDYPINYDLKKVDDLNSILDIATKYSKDMLETGTFNFKAFYEESLVDHLKNRGFKEEWKKPAMEAINCTAVCHYNDDIKLPTGKTETSLRLVEKCELMNFVTNRRYQIMSHNSVEFIELETI